MNTNLIPDLPFKFKSLEGYIWTATEKYVGGDGWVMYRSVRDKDGFTLNIPVIKMMMNLNSGHWQIVKTAKEELDDILKNEGQRALDYLKEKYMNEMPKLVAGKHWVVVENEGYGGIGLVVINGMIQYIQKEDGKPCYGYDIVEEILDYIAEVREIDNPPNFKSARVIWKKVDQKQLAIQKELEFAKAKAERLAAHISVLESKLK